MQRFSTSIAILLGIAALVCGCNGGSSSTAPVITAMTVPASAEINEAVAISVTAHDPGKLVLTYQWTCATGSIDNPTSPSCHWTAPPAPATGVVITVRVTNSVGEFVTASRTIDVIGFSGSVTTAVRNLITAECAGCHVAKPGNHTGSRDIDQCGACHVPYGNTQAVQHTGSTTGCTVCHPTPADTHFYLRDDNDQLVYKAGVEADCIACHRDGGHQTTGRGRPALDSDAAILAAARDGTLRAWIQPGGFMAKYLTPAQVTTLTDWVDSISNNRVLGYDPVLRAPSTSDFAINGLGNNPAWNSAPEHLVSVDPTIYTATSQVRLKALHSATYLYVRVQYADSTLSMTRSGSWIRPGGTWRHPIATTENDKQSEDRVSFIFNQTIPNFRDRYGCAVKCHGNVPGSSEFADLTGSMADIWHSKAARGMGVLTQSDNGALTVATAGEAFELIAGSATFTGWVDDKRLVWYMDLADGYDTEDSGRRGDAGSGAYSHNRNGSKTAPKYMEAAPDSWSDAMVLTQDEVDAGLLDGSVLVADPGAPGYDATDVTNAWANYQAIDAVVPERILKAPAGSRADVDSAASWNNGTWVWEFRRPMVTGNPDDVQFDLGVATDYPFSIAIFDNCGRGEIPPGHTTYGNGQYQILRFE